MTQPNADFITRKLDPEPQVILTRFSDELSEFVNFGSIIINWEAEKSIIKDEDLPAILFLRNFIEQVDAISVLMLTSSIEPCKILLRTVVENLLYIEYLLEKDTYNRSMAFLVWNTITNNKNIERLDENSEAYKKVQLVYSKDKFMKSHKPLVHPYASKLLAIGEQILSQPKYQAITFEYERTKTKLKKNNLFWYSLFDGPKNIKELAEQLNHHNLYDGYFRNFSAATHGTDIIQGKLVGKNNNDLGILQIRSPANAQSIAQSCSNFCSVVFSIFVKMRIPEKQNEFNRWHLGVRSSLARLFETQLIIPK